MQPHTRNARRYLGTRRKAETTQWKINVPIQVALEFDLLCINPALGKPIYGLRSQIITDLVQKYLTQIKEARNSNDHSPAGNTGTQSEPNARTNDPFLTEPSTWCTEFTGALAAGGQRAPEGNNEEGPRAPGQSLPGGDQRRNPDDSDPSPDEHRTRQGQGNPEEDKRG